MNDSPSALFRSSSLMPRHEALYLAHITCPSVSRGCIPWGKSHLQEAGAIYQSDEGLEWVQITFIN